MKNRQPHPIIALWVHPRSMSTAIERIMRERNDLFCFHEPFMYYYYIGLGKKELPLSDLHIGNPDSFDGIIQQFEHKAQTEPVFFKDMGYYVLPEIYQHPEIAQRMDHMILIRNPRKSILSYYKLDPTVSIEEVGLEAQWQLYQWLKDTCRRPPIVIEAEAIQNDPMNAMKRVWDYLGLEFRQNAFQWDPKTIPEDWKSVSGWHGNVMASTGIRPEKISGEEEIINRFNQAADDNPRLGELLGHHLPFYEKLKQQARAD